MPHPSPHSPHNSSLLSPAAGSTNSTFALVPELISANATHLDALARQTQGTELDIGVLQSLADVPFAGSFCHAVATALQAQSDYVTQLSEYGTGAALALSEFVSAVSAAEDVGARTLQFISPATSAAAPAGIGGM